MQLRNSHRHARRQSSAAALIGKCPPGQNALTHVAVESGLALSPAWTGWGTASLIVTAVNSLQTQSSAELSPALATHSQ